MEPSSVRSVIRVALAVSLGLVASYVGFGLTPTSAQQTPPSPKIWTVPEIGALPNDALGQQVRRGRDLITATYAHIGPEVADPAKRFAGNNLACANCHLQAGTQEVRHCRCSGSTGCSRNTHREAAARSRSRTVSTPA